MQQLYFLMGISSVVSKYAALTDSHTGQKEQVDMAKSLVNAVITKGPNGISEYYSSQTIEVRFRTDSQCCCLKIIWAINRLSICS